jgi:hypothetical protein
VFKLADKDKAFWKHLPINRLPTISLPVIQTVMMKVGMSRVEDSVSARPKGSIGGIQPGEKER